MNSIQKPTAASVVALPQEEWASSDIQNGNDPFQRSRSCWTAACIIAVLLPLLPLFQLHASFTGDWPCHIWLINYFGAYFAAHHTFPLTLNTVQMIGLAFPIFYGYLFFPLCGLLASLFEAEIVVRILAASLWTAEFILLYKLLVGKTGNRVFAYALTTCVLWAIYPLTNLYSRGAVPEFIATGLLTCALCLWLHALNSQRERQRMALCSLTVLLLTVSTGSHPITALYGLPFFCGFALLSLAQVPKRKALNLMLASILPICLSVICLLPWVMTTSTFAKKLCIADSFREVSYYRASLDDPLTRLSPVPRRDRHYIHRLRDEKVPSNTLDMQASLPLLMAFGWLLVVGISRRLLHTRLLLALMVVVAATSTFLFLSITPGSIDRIGFTARSIQFAYRLITYINLSALAGCLLIICFAKPFRNRADQMAEAQRIAVRNNASCPECACNESQSEQHFHSSQISIVPLSAPAHNMGIGVSDVNNHLYKEPVESGVLKSNAVRAVPGTAGDRREQSLLFDRRVAFGLAIMAALGLAAKLQVAQNNAIFHDRKILRSGSQAAVLVMPAAFYGFENYATPGSVQPLPGPDIASSHPINFTPLDGTKFGEIPPVHAYIDRGRWLTTNLQEFAWSRLSANSSKISSEKLAGTRKFLALKAEVGDVNVSYSFEPPLLWVRLHQLSIPLLLFWAFGTVLLFFSVDRRIARRRAS